MTFADISLSLTIFFLIALVNMIYAIRLIMVTRGRRIMATSMGFVESITFIYGLGRTINDLSQWHALLAYCLGTAIGGLVGMMIEARYIKSYIKISITTLHDGTLLAARLREKGYGATLTRGIGKSEQEVILIQCIVTQRDVQPILALVREVNPNAFITQEKARAVYRGWIPLWQTAEEEL